MFAKVFAAILAAVLASSSALQAPASLRLYVFDCGNLKSGNPDVLLARGVKVTDMSVAAYLIVHPQGTLLWDTGVIPDDLIKPDGTTEARATVKKTLKGQLAEIGYKSSDITYLALSHNHYDHSANANSFAGSTWLVQRQERDVMFPDTPSATPNAAAQRFSALQYGKTIVLDGDHDVFGDGSVIIISTPGHTPGHQSLFVNLNKTGPIILSGDLYHYPAERTLKDFTPFAALGNPEQEKRSKIKVEAWLQEKNATLWIQHDLIAWATLKKSPAYYE